MLEIAFPRPENSNISRGTLAPGPLDVSRAFTPPVSKILDQPVAFS